MTRALLDYFATDRASPLCSQNKRDKNSNRNSARELVWERAAHASGIFHNANFVWISPCIARYNHKVISPALAISFSYPQL